MPSFSAASEAKKKTCHPDIQRVLDEVIKEVDCTVLEGERTYEQQLEYFRTGKSKLNPEDPRQLVRAMHVKTPAMAVDVVPYPINWEDRERMAFFAGYVVATAKRLGVDLRWGGNWDADLSKLDKTASFFDAPHFELVE